MIKLDEFRRKNRIRQGVLASFFGVSQGFISQIEHGTRPLPDEFLSKLLANDQGWDTSMLTFGNIHQTGTTNVAGIGNVVNERPHPEYVGHETYEQFIKRLEETIERLEREKEEYWELIKKLTNK